MSQNPQQPTTTTTPTPNSHVIQTRNKNVSDFVAGLILETEQLKTKIYYTLLGYTEETVYDDKTGKIQLTYKEDGKGLVNKNVADQVRSILEARIDKNDILSFHDETRIMEKTRAILLELNTDFFIYEKENNYEFHTTKLNVILLIGNTIESTLRRSLNGKALNVFKEQVQTVQTLNEKQQDKPKRFGLF